MSVPTEADFVLIKFGDAADPEVFSAICGIQDATISRTVQTQDRFVRDCAKPGEVPFRKVKVTGKQLDVSGAGLTDKASVATLDAALGKVKNIKAECYQADGTDAGLLLGTFSFAGVLTSANMNIPRTGDASGEINVASHGTWTWAAAA